MPRIIISDYNFPDLDYEENLAKECNAEFQAYQCKTEQEVVEAFKGVDLALVQLAPVPPEAIEGLNKNAVIIRYGIGVDNLPLKACAEHGVRVCNVPDYGLAEVAEHSAALLLSLARRLPLLDKQVRDNEWDAFSLVGSVPGLSNTVVGTLGCGRIGRELIKRMSPFVKECIAYDPALDATAIQKVGARACRLR